MGRRSSSDEVEFSFGQLASVVHGVHCDLPSTGEWPIQSPCEHIGSALAADPVNPFTDSAQIRHFVMAITFSNPKSWTGDTEILRRDIGAKA